MTVLVPGVTLQRDTLLPACPVVTACFCFDTIPCLARSAIAGSVELPTMFLVGALLLGETIGPWQGFACLLVTLAILIAPARATRNLSTQMVLSRKAD